MHETPDAWVAVVLVLVAVIGSSEVWAIFSAERSRRAAAQTKPTPTKRRTCLSGGCDAFRSPDCVDGRCRWHCKLYCGCESKQPPRAPGQPHLIDKRMN